LILQEDVDGFMKREENESAEAVLVRLDEQHRKYKFMEYNILTKKSRYNCGCFMVFNITFNNISVI